jgi:four helix bundle protein
MARDYRQLHVFQSADALALEMYRFTARLPDEERFALVMQIRRAAVSVPANLAEGSERSSQKEFLRYVDIAAGSAAEVRYLLSLARRLGYDVDGATRFEQQYDVVVRSLQNLRTSLQRSAGNTP